MEKKEKLKLVLGFKFSLSPQVTAIEPSDPSRGICTSQTAKSPSTHFICDYLITFVPSFIHPQKSTLEGHDNSYSAFVFIFRDDDDDVSPIEVVIELKKGQRDRIKC